MLVVIVVIGLLVILVGPQLWVQRTLARYARPADRYQGTGAELAEHLIALEGLSVNVEQTKLGDHYDPIDKTVRLSDKVFNGRSLMAITVAAHEVGHAIQDASNYGPLRLRTRLAVSINALEKVGAVLLLAAPVIGVIFRLPSVFMITVLAGLAVLGGPIIMHAFTLPTEFNASFSRALPLLRKHDILIEGDEPHAERILKAAAYTYVAASLMSLLNVARWWTVLRS